MSPLLAAMLGCKPADPEPQVMDPHPPATTGTFEGVENGSLHLDRTSKISTVVPLENGSWAVSIDGTWTAWHPELGPLGQARGGHPTPDGRWVVQSDTPSMPFVDIPVPEFRAEHLGHAATRKGPLRAWWNEHTAAALTMSEPYFGDAGASPDGTHRLVTVDGGLGIQRGKQPPYATIEGCLAEEHSWWASDNKRFACRTEQGVAIADVDGSVLQRSAKQRVLDVVFASHAPWVAILESDRSLTVQNGETHAYWHATLPHPTDRIALTADGSRLLAYGNRDLRIATRDGWLDPLEVQPGTGWSVHRDQVSHPHKQAFKLPKDVHNGRVAESANGEWLLVFDQRTRIRVHLDTMKMENIAIDGAREALAIDDAGTIWHAEGGRIHRDGEHLLTTPRPIARISVGEEVTAFHSSGGQTTWPTPAKTAQPKPTPEARPLASDTLRYVAPSADIREVRDIPDADRRRAWSRRDACSNIPLALHGSEPYIAGESLRCTGESLSWGQDPLTGVPIGTDWALHESGLVAVADAGRVYMWKRGDGLLWNTRPFQKGGAQGYGGLAIDPSGTQLAVAVRHGVVLLSTTDGTQVGSLPYISRDAQRQPVFLGWSEDGRELTSSNGHRWEVPTRTMLLSPEPVVLAIRGEGQHIAVAQRGALSLYDHEGERIATTSAPDDVDVLDLTDGTIIHHDRRGRITRLGPDGPIETGPLRHTHALRFVDDDIQALIDQGWWSIDPQTGHPTFVEWAQVQTRIDGMAYSPTTVFRWPGFSGMAPPENPPCASGYGLSCSTVGTPSESGEVYWPDDEPVAPGPGMHTLAIVSGDGRAHLRNASGDTHIGSLRSVRQLAWASPDLLVGARQSEAVTWDAQGNALAQAPLPAGFDMIHWVTASSDGRIGLESRELIFWGDLANGRVDCVLPGEGRHLVVNPDGTRAAWFHADKLVTADLDACRIASRSIESVPAPRQPKPFVQRVNRDDSAFELYWGGVVISLEARPSVMWNSADLVALRYNDRIEVLDRTGVVRHRIEYTFPERNDFMASERGVVIALDSRVVLLTQGRLLQLELGKAVTAVAFSNQGDHVLWGHYGGSFGFEDVESLLNRAEPYAPKSPSPSSRRR